MRIAVFMKPTVVKKDGADNKLSVKKIMIIYSLVEAPVIYKAVLNQYTAVSLGL